MEYLKITLNIADERSGKLFELHQIVKYGGKSEDVIVAQKVFNILLQKLEGTKKMQKYATSEEFITEVEEAFQKN